MNKHLFLIITVAGLGWTVGVLGGEIHDAAAAGSLEKVQALLKADPTVATSKDEGGRTPLHRAALFGYRPVIELLLANKASASAKDYYGRTAADVANAAGYMEVAELLRQRARAEVPSAPATPTTPAPSAAKAPEAKPVEKPAAPTATKNYGRFSSRSGSQKDVGK